MEAQFYLSGRNEGRLYWWNGCAWDISSKALAMTESQAERQRAILTINNRFLDSEDQFEVNLVGAN